MNGTRRLFAYSSIILYLSSYGKRFEPHAQSIPQVARGDPVLLLIPHPILRHVLRTLHRIVFPLLAQIYTRFWCSGYARFVRDPLSIPNARIRFGGFGAVG